VTVFDRSLVLPQLLAAWAAKEPDADLVQDVAGPSITVGAVHDLALQWAGAYRRLGVGEGDTVLTMLPNCIEAFGTWLGAAWLRAIEVPMNTMFRGHMFRYVVNDSRASVVVIAARYLDQLREVAADLEHVRTLVVLETDERPDDLPFEVLLRPEVLDGAPATRDELGDPAHHDIACMIYTSGTTGPSKGVLMPWRELYEFPASAPDGMFEPGGSCYIVLPIFHVSGKQALYSAVMHHYRLVIRDVFSLSEFWSDVKRFGCSSTGLIGVMASLLHRMPDHPDQVDSPLRNLAMGPVIPEIDEFCARFGLHVASGYGMTEIGVPFGTDGFNVHGENWTSCGYLRPGYEARVVDDHDEPVGPGEVGELVVRTAEPWMLCAGYWHQPEKTAEAWRNGWFHTGDGFMYDEEGAYYFKDRIKDAIRRRGENISSFEVEAYVGEHEAVQEVAAIAVPSDVTEDDVKVVVVLQPDARLTPAELYEFLEPRMPRFMLPRYIEIVDALPKTPTLRTKKVELRADSRNATTWDRDTASAPRR
jgi:crotonobetaine/carnitine-CoA ligase